MRDNVSYSTLSFYFCKEGMLIAYFKHVYLLSPSQNKGVRKRSSQAQIGIEYKIGVLKTYIMGTGPFPGVKRPGVMLTTHPF
jgi:hypothetical protein